MLDPTEFRDIVSGKRRDLVARLVRPCLMVAEIPYRAVVDLRNRRFDTNASLTTRVNVPVISVGNLTMGGTGKTPMVCWIARWFHDQGVRVAIVSRGYGSKSGRKNDEAIELEQRLPEIPHLQNPDRIHAARQAIQKHASQVILLDDGFQHRRIARDLNIVLIDATDPFGCEHVFPRGMLREPINNIMRADVICLTRCDLVSEARLEAIESRYRALCDHADFLRMRHRPARWINSCGKTVPLEAMVNKRVAAICALGNPVAFRHTLESCGCEISLLKTFPDHYQFRPEDMLAFQDQITDEVDFLACSHKDLVKLNRDKMGKLDLFALQIDMEFMSDKNHFVARLEEMIRRIRI